MSKKLSRRDWLKQAALGLAGLALFGGAPKKQDERTRQLVDALAFGDREVYRPCKTKPTEWTAAIDNVSMSVGLISAAHLNPPTMQLWGSGLSAFDAPYGTEVTLYNNESIIAHGFVTRHEGGYLEICEYPRCAGVGDEQ